MFDYSLIMASKTLRVISSLFNEWCI